MIDLSKHPVGTRVRRRDGVEGEIVGPSKLAEWPHKVQFPDFVGAAQYKSDGSYWNKPDNWDITEILEPSMADARDDKIDGLQSELRDVAKALWDRDGKDYVRSNYPEWAKEWDAPPKPEMVEVDGRVYVHSPANLGQFSYHNGVRAAARLHITGPVPKRASDADLPTYEARIMPEGWRETITHHLHCLDRSNPLAAFLRAILGESE